MEWYQGLKEAMSACKKGPDRAPYPRQSEGPSAALLYGHKPHILPCNFRVGTSKLRQVESTFTSVMAQAQFKTSPTIA